MKLKTKHINNFNSIIIITKEDLYSAKKSVCEIHTDNGVYTFKLRHLNRIVKKLIKSGFTIEKEQSYIKENNVYLEIDMKRV